MTSRESLLIAVALVGMVAGSARGADELDDLLRRLPPTANTVCIVDLKAIRAAEGKAEVTMAGAVFPPPVDIIVFATHLEPDHVDGRRTGGIAKLNRKVNLKEIATARNGEVVNVGNMVIIDFGKRGLAVPFGDDLIGFARGLNQQELYRWKKFAEANTKISLHAHMVEALKFAKDAPIFGAIDLEYVLNARKVAERLAGSRFGSQMPRPQIDQLAEFIASVQDVSLAVRGEDLGTAEIRFNFAQDVGNRGELVKAVFLEALDDLGATINEFAGGKVASEGRTVQLTTRLTPSGLNRILSLFVQPPPSAPPPTGAEAPKVESNGASVEATRQYFRGIDAMLTDLRKTAEQAPDYRKAATWHETYASRIDSMNTHYVDPDLVKWGQSLSPKLRSLGYSLKGVIVEVEALQAGMAEVVYASGGGWGAWGGSSIQAQSNATELRTKQAEIIQKDGARRLKIWESIDQDRANMLKLLAERYNLDPTKAKR